MAVRLEVSAVAFHRITNPDLTAIEFTALWSQHGPLINNSQVFEMRTGKKTVHMNGMHVVCEDDADAVAFKLKWLCDS